MIYRSSRPPKQARVPQAIAIKSGKNVDETEEESDGSEMSISSDI